MRIIPITLFALFISLFFRGYSIVTGEYNEGESLVVASSIAAGSSEAEKKEEDHSDDDGHGEAADDGHGEVELDDHGNPVVQEEPEEPYDGPPNLADQLDDDETFSQVEIDLLQSLSKRREELEERERQIEIREEIIRATEIKIDDKISEMKALKSTLETLMASYDEKEQENINSLVKIYENMKPKEAALIFEEIDMVVLLQVVSRMKERKLAPILAKMTPSRAKEVTIELADQKKLPPVDDVLE